MDKVSQSGLSKQSKEKDKDTLSVKSVRSAISIKSGGSTKSGHSKRSLRIKNAPAVLREGHLLNKLLNQSSLILSESVPKGVIKTRSQLDIESDDGEDKSLELFYTPDSMSAGGSYVFQNEIALPADFFGDLGDVPNLDDISSTMSEDVVEEEPETKKTSLVGQFVDPVTGVVTYGDDEEEEEEVASVVAEPEPVEDEELKLLLAVPDTKEVELDQFLVEEEAFETFLEETRRTVVIEEELDFAAIEREERELRIITAQFLEKLIGQIVEVCEWVDPRDVMRAQLDKEKLIPELKVSLKELEETQKMRAVLNRKTVEFFRRKKAFRSITDDNPLTVQKDNERFQEALIILDGLLGRERELKVASETKLSELTEEFQQVENETNTKITEFEELLKKTLGRENSERLQIEVQRMLNEIGNMRQQLSEVRYTLVLRQHTMGQLVEKTNELEDLGNGLHMADFERLQTEVQALGKKIEERNAELDKLHLRCNSDVEILAHLREKQSMLKANLHVQKDAIYILQRERYELRELLYQAKMEHSKITREIRELSFQCGLLDKPALMLDYDKTTERLDDVRARVEDVRGIHASLLQKIVSLERKCKISAKSR